MNLLLSSVTVILLVFIILMLLEMKFITCQALCLSYMSFNPHKEAIHELVSLLFPLICS